MPSSSAPTPKQSKPRSPRARPSLKTRPRSKKPVKTLTRSSRSDAAAAITNYTTALRWLHEHTDFERMRIVRYNERTFNLDRMRQLLDLIGNPHEQLRCVQIAGTKGKGSTCAMLA